VHASARLENRETGSVFTEWFDPDGASSFDSELDRLVCAHAIATGSVSGRCNLCGNRTSYSVTSEVVRETLACSVDGSNGRHRAIAAALSQELFGESDRDIAHVIERLSSERKHVYLAEVNTSIALRFAASMPAELLAVSEYYGDEYASGDFVGEFRHENLERISFADERFDVIVTSEVMEHVPDVLRAEREIVRVLRPGGIYLFTVPLSPWGDEDIILSKMQADGTIVHFGEPQYHGDPKRAEGILAYRIFSVRALQRRFEALGCEFLTYRFWSKSRGILGDYAWVHVVRKIAVS